MLPSKSSASTTRGGALKRQADVAGLIGRALAGELRAAGPDD